MDTSQLIEIYSICFYIFLGIAILGFALAVFFFFFFDIPTVFALMTGRAQKKTIERMEKRNAKNASIRNTSGPLNMSGGLTAGLSGEMSGDLGRTESIAAAPLPTGLAGDAVPEPMMAGGAVPEGASVTTVLQGDGSTETTVLQDAGSTETTLLQNNGSTETAMLQNGSSMMNTIPPGSGETTILTNNGFSGAENPNPDGGAPGAGETSILRQPEPKPAGYLNNFIVTEDTVIIHSDENI